MNIKAESKNLSSEANFQESAASITKLEKYVDVSCILTNILLGKKKQIKNSGLIIKITVAISKAVIQS